MRAYYDRRAAEYDDWWLGTGRLAERSRPGWEEDVAGLCAALAAMAPVRTLDLACGTGFLTQHLPGSVVGLDQSEAMLAVARARCPDASFVVGDALDPPRGFQRVFSAHFYGHLDAVQRARFLRVECDELIVVDSAGEGEAWEERELDDGSRHRVYKRWFSAEGLAAEIGGEAFYAGPWFVAVRRRTAALRQR